MPRALTLCLRLLLLSLPLGLAAQNKPGLELHVRKAVQPIKIDGILDEPDWQLANPAKDFFLNYPVDTIAPAFQSEARITFDQHFLYFGITCFDDEKPNIVQSLRRDIEWDLNDNIGVYMDPFNDYTNGFFFTITPMGVQSEGIMSGGGANDDSFNDSWDNKWYSKVTRHSDKWVVEIGIPWKTIRYNITNWNITFLRNDVKRNQVSSWIATPIAYIPASFAYSGKLIWEEMPPKPHSNISFIPYLSGSTSKDFENEDSDNQFNGGFDAKVGITPSLNLDLTVNPDFSQVEVDRQVINLTRFEFGFPERRQFFLENNDLFSQGGFPDSRPFFSRRIGLASDSSGNIARVPILYGARISGKIGEDWRIGAMNLHTQEKKSLGLPAQNYSVAVAQRQIFSRSNIGFVFVNKQSLGLDEYDASRNYHRSLVYEKVVNGDTVQALNKFNRVFGMDFNLYSKDNRWQGDFYYHRSMDAKAEDENYSFGAYLGYNTRNLNVAFAQQALGQNFNAEVGFVPSLDVYPGYYAGFSQIEYRMYPKESRIAVMAPQVEFNYVMTPDAMLTDRILGFGYEINFLNTSQLEIGVSNIFQKLPEDFNPLDPKGDSTLLMGQRFSWNEGGVAYRSDTRKVFNYSFEGVYGGFYNGHLLRLSTELNYRYQPFGSLSVRIDYSALDFPSAYGKANFLLIGPRLDLTFTDKLFLTSFVQYNDRNDNVNLNARFQWRFKPASDFFLVYTENYFPEGLNSKNRALVLKLTYWLNL
jgi:hypothetical protein